MNITKSIGPSTDPCGIPEVTSLQLENSPLTFTLCFLLLRKLLTQLHIFSLSPYFFSLYINLWCGTLSLCARKCVVKFFSSATKWNIKLNKSALSLFNYKMEGKIITNTNSPVLYVCRVTKKNQILHLINIKRFLPFSTQCYFLRDASCISNFSSANERLSRTIAWRHKRHDHTFPPTR